jgi:DNA replication licensing factor MCM5
MKVESGFHGVAIPRICDNQKNPGLEKQQCKIDSYVVITSLCEYVDQQTLKIQEAPELIPTGEMPRSFVMTCDRNLSDKVTPGNRVKIVGIFSIMNKSGGSDANAKKLTGSNIK